MKSSCILLLFVAANAFDRLEWEAFKVKHGKKYGTQSEERNRMRVFFENQRAIEDHNKKFHEGLVSFSMKMNHFGDLTVQEFKSQMNKWKNNTRAPQFLSTFQANNGSSLPDSVDWRQQGAVTPVKNQLQCGACWAFSATGSLEGQYFKYSGVLVSLSEQQLVDCSSGYGNSCSGGLMNQAFIYLAAAGGIDTEESYPYEGKVDSCRFQQSSVVTTVKKVFNIPADEGSLQEAVATAGPISVALDAGHQSFQFYSQGIYYESACSSSSPDHGALAVGYGSEDGLDFWSVKNSWGSDWGEGGYIRMSRNKGNNCGIATEASYPQV